MHIYAEGGNMEIQAAIVLIIVFFLLLAFSVPVSFSIISASLVTLIMFLTPHFGVFISAQKMVTGIDSFTLLAVPFFVLAGLLMSNGGIAKRLINLAMLVLGKVPGSLAMTNIAGNAMFGSISGSGIAAATAIGGVMQPLENEQGYDRAFSAAANVASAPVGQLIPPTASFIVFSAASGGVSVAALLMAGWIPGLLWALLCMVVAFVYGKKHGYVIKRDHLTAKVVLKTIWDAIPSLFLIVIIIGGILSGYFTPTEASGVAVVYAFILAVFVYKSIRIKDIPRILELLKQVLQIHADIRPDIFIPDTTKYTTDELTELLKNKEKPVYVAVNEDDVCIGYAFCQLQEQPFSNNMVQFKSLFIDDLCVDQEARGQHIGESLFEYVKSEAKQLGCYEVTLNVWAGNISAEKFYEKMGMRTKERQMEYIL